ncbi:MAG: response regulator [Spirochaetota bacterium]|nr:response regulator [Spirochaetota bacterium]
MKRRRTRAFFRRIDIQIILILLFLTVLLSLLAGYVNGTGLYNAYKTNLTDWILFTNKLIGITIDAEEIKYYADMMLSMDEKFRERQKRFFHDREEYLGLRDTNAPIEEQKTALAKMNKFLDVAKVYKTERYWNLVEKFRSLKTLGHAKFLYVFMDAGLTDDDGTILYPYIVDADDMDVYESYDNDGFGTVTTQGDEVQQIYALKKPLPEVGVYEGGYGKLYYAHAPIMDSEGNIIAILGTDIDIDEMYGEIAEYINLSNWLFFACFISLILTVYFFLRASVTNPVRKLTGTIQSIAEGKMFIPVPAQVLKSRNEIGILANAIKDLRGVFQSVARESEELADIVLLSKPAFHHDISARSMTDKIETYIDESKWLVNILKNILDGVDAIVYATVPETGEIIFLNQAMKSHYKLEGDYVGQRCYKVLQQGINKRCPFCPCHELDKDPKKVIVWEMHSALTKRIYRNTDRYIEWPGGMVVHLQHSIDITELIEAKEEAIQANTTKSEFLARISHEIRTPMNAVFGIAEIHLQENLSPEMTEAFSRIYQSASVLLVIINDLLDLSKIEAGKMELLPVRYDIAGLIRDAVQLNVIYIGSKPIEFNLHIDPSIPLELLGDCLRIKQILNNLLSNAFKYTREGFVLLDVTADCFPDAENDVVLVFKVRDSGSGMLPEQVQVLYNEYTRFNPADMYATEGTGLGMSITRRLVEMMGGEICITSEPGKGSEFCVRLPQKSQGPERIGRDLAENLRQFHIKTPKIIYEPMPYGRVLIVDDLETNLFVAKGLLTPYKLQIDTAGSGFEAIDKINAGGAYDIVFMDHLMPVMDGMETVRRLRGDGWTGPIIALTANALAGQEEKFTQNGFDACIFKPIDVNNLDAVLRKYIRGKQLPIQAALNQNSGTSIVSSQVAGIFAQDAKRILADLETEMAGEKTGKESFQQYAADMHALKGALANIGKTELSKQAAFLEERAKTEDIPAFRSRIGEFMDSIRSLITDMTPAAGNAEYPLSGEDRQYLREKLRTILDAAIVCDIITLQNTIGIIMEKTWPPSVQKLLSAIAEHLLHNRFETIIEDIRDFEWQ